VAQEKEKRKERGEGERGGGEGGAMEKGNEDGTCLHGNQVQLQRCCLTSPPTKMTGGEGGGWRGL
jgi:hypothetical protein